MKPELPALPNTPTLPDIEVISRFSLKSIYRLYHDRLPGVSQQVFFSFLIRGRPIFMSSCLGSILTIRRGCVTSWMQRIQSLSASTRSRGSRQRVKKHALDGANGCGTKRKKFR